MGLEFQGDFDYKQTKSLGLHLIPMLCEQIDASMEMTSEKGIKYAIKFEQKETI
jgi:two-component sensor histidine kinase